MIYLILYQLSDYITCQAFALFWSILQVPSFSDVYVEEPKTNIKSCTEIIKGPFPDNISQQTYDDDVDM